ncbi:electron transport complex protein RnfB [Syntrophus gentianae]|uniref:Ion-translocating oxidoreductase complex subunit B n=1 Tax=Syntrophus gentianae TaxID=43775 RepID=A0A1H7VSR0_9BACT|nr:Fe-S cluster domain-containing protein [Syntrophus gentianae]SEM11837.1 electron transport complex protein RnfB [Syntrophus gentianae]
MDPVLLKLALGGIAFLVCIGLLFGIGLALAAQKFAVEANPKVEEVLEVLAGAQCGGCGYPGCEGYAEAVVNDPDVPTNLCFPGKAAVAEAVAEITGKKVGGAANIIASVRCSRIDGGVGQKYQYLGYETCAGASLAFGGPQECSYACIGLGDCVASCPFGAITLENAYPVIDAAKCVGCGSCMRACPKKVIELIPLKARVWVPCSTHDPGKTVRALCKVGCITCKMCVKACPAGAVSVENDLVRIDHEKCLAYGPECNLACVEKCPRKIFQTFQTEGKKAGDLKAA